MKLLPRPIPLTPCRSEGTGLCNNSFGNRNKLDREWEIKLRRRRRRLEGNNEFSSAAACSNPIDQLDRAWGAVVSPALTRAALVAVVEVEQHGVVAPGAPGVLPGQHHVHHAPGAPGQDHGRRAADDWRRGRVWAALG